jgi:Zn-dependent protease with chaperone function/HEAT repeat protein
MKKSKRDDAPISPPTGTIPHIHTADSLETAVTLSALVIGFMVGLYVLLTLAWGWLTIAFCMALPELIEDRGMILQILYYCLAGSLILVLIFLIKPLLPLGRKQAPPIELKEADQPELFAYIRALAKCIDAPEPERVLVDVHANASASFAGGMSPTSGPLTLTLGLPLIGGMSVRQLAGVIAHELGHFAQGSMIKQNIVIGFVSGWLTAVALGEDRFDHVIHRLSVSAPPGVRHLFKIIRTVMVAIRRVFYVVMVVGHLVTRMAARQLEFDADQFMVHTIGSEHFADTMRETLILGHASMHAIEDAAKFYRDRRLPNDLPAMVVTKARRMDTKQRKKIISGEEQDQAEAFSTHPLTSKRVDAALALKSKGLVHDDRPARGLFRDFDKLCQEASEALYKELIGKDYDAKHLTDSSRLIAEQEATDKARKSAMRFCQSELLLMLPVFPTYRGLRMPENPQEALDKVRTMRERAKSMRDRAYPLTREYNEANDKLMQSRMAHAATQSGFEIRDFKAMGLEAGNAAGLTRVVSDQTKVIERLENQVSEYNDELIKRMEIDFALLKHPKVLERVGEARANRVWAEIDALVPAGQALANAHDAYENMRVHANILATGLNLIMQGIISHQLIEKINQAGKDTVDDITDLLRAVGREKYPFAHGEGRVNMAAAICDKPPDADNLGDIYFVAEDLAGRFVELRERIIGRLCHHAERIEKVMGMKPLPEADEADGLDELLEKIGVKDNLPTQDESPSATGLIGALLTQGVMGVTVLGLSGIGVYALLPTAPPPEAPEPSIYQQFAQQDDPPAVTRPRDERTSDPQPPDRPPEQREPAVQQSDPNENLSVDMAIKLMASSVPKTQLQGASKFTGARPTMTPAQNDALIHAAAKLAGSGRSTSATHAIQILNRYASDGGLEAIARNLPDGRSYIDPVFINHLASFNERKAADLLVRIIQGGNYRQYVTKTIQGKPVAAHLEDALLDSLSISNRYGSIARREMMWMLESIATQQSADLCTQLLNDRDTSIQQSAKKTLERLDPRNSDAAAQLLRLTRSSANITLINSAISKLARLKPEAGDERRPEVCEAVLQWMKRTNRRLDSTSLDVLANWGDAPAVPLYMDMLKDPDAQRFYLKRVMQLAGEQASEEQAEQVATAIGNWFLLETDAVADALIAMGPAGEFPAIEHLESEHEVVRLGCIKVISAVGSERGLNALRSLGKDPDRNVRDSARSAFYALRDKLREEEG